MTFANPYNFVAIDEDNIFREKNYLKHEQFSGISGRIVCQLSTKSNLITAGKNNSKEKHQYQINKLPVIQASSLKGMLRATAEAISNSCLSQINASYDNKRIVKNEALIESCNITEGLCYCCRLFGTTATKNKEMEQPFTFKGKVILGDAKYINGNPVYVKKYLKNHQLNSPHIHHKSFYFNDDKIKGRKFYYHHREDQLLREDQLWDQDKNESSEMLMINKDVNLQFTLAFENLSEEEYALLLLTLELEEGMYHKIGMGKPLGLGSCKIKITELKELNKDRYKSIDGTKGWIEYENEALINRIGNIKKLWKNGIPDDLKCILSYENNFTEIRYPIKGGDEFNRDLHKPCKEFD